MELTPDLIRDLSATAVLALVLFALIRGWLVTKRELDAKDAELIRNVAETQKWQDAYVTEAKAKSVGHDQVSELLESSRTIRTFIQSLAEAVPKR